MTLHLLPHVQAPFDASQWWPTAFLTLSINDVPVVMNGMARGPFAICPEVIDMEDVAGFNVGAVYLPMGSLLFMAPHGSKAMAIGDWLIDNAPEFLMPYSEELLDWLGSNCIRLREGVAALGGLPLFEA